METLETFVPASARLFRRFVFSRSTNVVALSFARAVLSTSSLTCFIVNKTIGLSDYRMIQRVLAREKVCDREELG